jgi:predicted aspartyl protease
MVEAAHGALMVPVTIAGQARAMIIDTGAMQSMVRGADVTGLPHLSAPDGPLRGLGGKSMAEIVRLPTLALGAVLWRDATVYVGPDGFSPDPRLAGILGANLLRAYDVEIDPAAGRVSLLSQDRCSGNPLGGSGDRALALPIEVGPGGWIVVPVTLDGVRLRAIIDTGADTSVIGVDSARARFHLEPGDPGTESIGESRTADGGRVAASRHRFQTLEIGSARFDAPWLTIMPVHLGDAGGAAAPDLVIGMHQLRALHLYIAYRQHMLFGQAIPGDLGGRAGGSDALDQSEAASRAERAKAALARRDFSGAIADLDEAIRLAPEVSAYRINRGTVEAEAGQFDRAIADFDAALAADPRNAAALYDRGLAKRQQGGNPAGEADILAARKIDPMIGRGAR